MSRDFTEVKLTKSLNRAEKDFERWSVDGAATGRVELPRAPALPTCAVLSGSPTATNGRRHTS
jgi:hypothetical protein